MLKILLLSLLIFVNSINSNIIKGKILDSNTKETLTGVRIISDCDTVYSDFNGCFEIKYQLNKTNLRFDLISYNSDNLEIKSKYNKFFMKR